MKKYKTYYLFTVQCFEARTDKDERLHDLATVSVIATNHDGAIKKAQKLIKKKGYRVSAVTEYIYDKRLEGKK